MSQTQEDKRLTLVAFDNHNRRERVFISSNRYELDTTVGDTKILLATWKNKKGETLKWN